MSNSQDGVWLTYDELSKARGVKRDAAIRITQRRKWHRQTGEDGKVRIWVPQEDAKPLERPVAPQPIDLTHAALETLRDALDALQKAHRSEVASLRAQIVALERRRWWRWFSWRRRA